MGKLNKAYIVGLSLIAIFTFFSQIFIQTFLNEQEEDAKTINIAGRQRMLSQKIVKNILLIEKSINYNDFMKLQKELSEIKNLWVKSHDGLQNGNPQLLLSKRNQSITLNNLYKKITPHYQKIENFTSRVLLLKYQNRKSITNQFTQRLLKAEKSFLELMNQIVFQYEKEANSRVQHLSLVEKILMSITLLILILEAVFIFRPMVKAIKANIQNIKIDKLKLENDLLFEIKQHNIELEYQQNKINKINKELTASNQKLQINQEELRQSNEFLEKKVQERTQEIEDQSRQTKRLYRDLSASVKYARQIQKAILPKHSQIQMSFPNSFVFFRPLNVVSGDFYFYAETSYKKVIAAVDSTGHGIPGAFMSLIGNDLLYEIIKTKGVTSPELVLSMLKESVIRVLRQKETGNRDGMDLAICVIDSYPKELKEDLGIPTLQYAGAKNPLVIIQDEEMRVIKGDKINIGGFEIEYEDKTFTNHIIPLHTATTFYIFSDGIQDQFGGVNNKKFSSKRLYKLLFQIHQEPMEKQKNILENIIGEWQEESKQEQIDDMLLIGVKI